MARLDRLGAAKEVAQIGAAIGREIHSSCWPLLCASRKQEFRPALDRIVRAGLLFRQGVPPHASYLFKHALVQDAAYGTFCVSPDVRSTLASPKHWRASSLTSLTTSLRFWRVTAPKPD